MAGQFHRRGPTWLALLAATTHCSFGTRTGSKCRACIGISHGAESTSCSGFQLFSMLLITTVQHTDIAPVACLQYVDVKTLTVTRSIIRPDPDTEPDLPSSLASCLVRDQVLLDLDTGATHRVGPSNTDAMCFHPLKHQFAEAKVGDECKVQLWGFQDGELYVQQSAQLAPLRHIVSIGGWCRRNHQGLLLIRMDKIARVWQLILCRPFDPCSTDGAVIAAGHEIPPSVTAVSADGTVFAFIAGHTAVDGATVWQEHGPRIKCDWPRGMRGALLGQRPLAISPSKRWLSVASDDGIVLFDLSRGLGVVSILLRTVLPPCSLDQNQHGLIWFPDETRLLVHEQRSRYVASTFQGHIFDFRGNSKMFSGRKVAQGPNVNGRTICRTGGQIDLMSLFHATQGVSDGKLDLRGGNRDRFRPCPRVSSEGSCY